MMKLFYSAFFTLFLLQTSPAIAAKPELLNRASEIAKICQDHMPNSVKTGEVLRKSGFRFEGIANKFRIYSLKGRRIVAATTITKAGFHGCIVSVSKMTPEEAKVLVQPWLKAANAKLGKPSSKKATTWFGTFKGAKVRVEVINRVDFGIMRGAAITVRTLN